MKITITHDQSTIDPSETYSEEDFRLVKAAYEKELEVEILKAFPKAEIVFACGGDCCIKVEFPEHWVEPMEIWELEDEITNIVADVYATGNFWL